MSRETIDARRERQSTEVLTSQGLSARLIEHAERSLGPAVGLLGGPIIGVDRSWGNDDPGGKPVIAVPGLTPTFPLTTLAPVLVTVEAPSTPKLSATPRVGAVAAVPLWGYALA